MSLVLSYKLGLTTQQTVGTNPYNSKENLENLIVQQNLNTLENARPFKFSFVLGANSTKLIQLEELGIRYLKLICIESTNIIKYSYSDELIRGSLIFVDRKIPTTIPTALLTDFITIDNISSEIVNLTVAIVGII